jgi:ComF family protein
LFFNKMSNFSEPRPIQAPVFSAGRFPWPGQDCALCGAVSGDAVICGACEAALPRLGKSCERCAVPLPMAGVCGRCQRHAPAFDAALASFEYRFPIDRVIHRFKYSADLAMGRWLSLRLLDRVRVEPLPDLIVAPPLTAARLRERGFNQAVEIAKVVGRKLRVPCVLAGLAKVRETAPQPGLGRAQRRANLRHAFRCDLALDGERVALVDDVMTTGATADALARVLKAAGAATVSVWAVARTPDPAED